MEEKIEIEDWTDTEVDKEEKKENKSEGNDEKEEKSVCVGSIVIELEIVYGSVSQECMFEPIITGAINSFKEAMHKAHKKNRVTIGVGKRYEVEEL